LDNEAIQSKPLRISKELSEEEFRSMTQRIRAYTAFRIRARFSSDFTPDEADGLLIELVETADSDAELNHLAQEMQKTMTVSDDQFGEFILNRRLNWLLAKTTWNSTPVELVLKVDTYVNHTRQLNIAKLLWDMQPDWNEKVYDVATSKLLELKNSAWLGENEEPLSSEQFRLRIKRKTIIAYQSGKIEFWCEDGDLFLGHEILVEGNLSEGPANAKIVG
jgi:hypothetical protein